MIYFTSDLHIGHANMAIMRGYSLIDIMDEEIISSWNNTVSKNDTVFVLGDMFYKNKNYENVLDILNGNIVLVRGNHDPKQFKERKNLIVTNPYLELTDKNINYYGHNELPEKIVLCHYPIEDWNWAFHGSWHLHGHVHGKLGYSKYKRLDVGWDMHKKLLSLDDIKNHMKNRENYRHY